MMPKEIESTEKIQGRALNGGMSMMTMETKSIINIHMGQKLGINMIPKENYFTKKIQMEQKLGMIMTKEEI